MSIDTETVAWPALGYWTGSTYLIDRDTWDEAYCLGYRHPNHPVPAIRDNCFDHLHSAQRGGLRGYWRYYGSKYIDWSRGSLEVY